MKKNKKTACICLAFILSFIISAPASKDGIAGEKTVTTQVIDMGDSVKVEAVNMNTGETEFLTLNDCTKTVDRQLVAWNAYILLVGNCMLKTGQNFADRQKQRKL